MKTFLLIPIIVATALSAAAGLCWMAGVPLHGKDLILAAVVAVIAAELGLIPSFLLRRSDPSIRAQMALGGTVVHLMVTILVAAAVMTAKVVEPREPFVYWLTGAYWASLAMLCWGLVRETPGGNLKTK